MMIKIAVPNQFKLKVMPNFRTFFSRIKKTYTISEDPIFFLLRWKWKRKAARSQCWGTEEDKSARKILIEHNLRLVVYIAKKKV